MAKTQTAVIDGAATTIFEEDDVPLGVDENPRQRRPLSIRPAPTKGSAEPVRVCCTVDNRPWADVYEDEDGEPVVNFRPLARNEVATVPEWMADIMVANGHVAKV